jgi:hypothetical protein
MFRNRLSERPLTIAAVGVVLVLTVPAYAQSEADCAARAERAARNSYGVVGGAVAGAAGGAAIGAIVSGSRSYEGIMIGVTTDVMTNDAIADGRMYGEAPPSGPRSAQREPSSEGATPTDVFTEPLGMAQPASILHRVTLAVLR